jgi:hypothetical protein
MCRIFEIGALHLTELDAEGGLVAAVLFDFDDRAAASDELFERWAARTGLSPHAIERVRAWNRHDLEGCRVRVQRPPVNSSESGDEAYGGTP